MIIDLRSDTVTKPTPEMVNAMFAAQVGDDVFIEDPTINALEEKAAKLFGMEAALFCPSGTMTNQIAIKLHTQPGGEVICDELAHVYNYEGGGIAYNSGCSVRLVKGDRGRFTVKEIEENINNIDDVHKPITQLVCVENTTNKGGGACYDIAELEKMSAFCKQNNLAFHLDGARLFNALVYKNESPEQYGQLFDTISICLSKGLGCPVGSLLLGSKEHIRKARRIRKVLGGGMRQAGYLAATGIYALDNNVSRMVDDHKMAKQIEAVLNEQNYVKEILPVETNIVIFKLKDTYSDAAFVEHMKDKGILLVSMGEGKLRFVTHINVTPEMLDQLLEELKAFDGKVLA